MRIIIRSILFLVLLSFVCRTVLHAEDIMVRVYLFRSDWKEAISNKDQVKIFTASSRPELASFKEKAGLSDVYDASTVSEALMNIYNVDTVDYLFMHEKAWSGRGTTDYNDIIKGVQNYYRIRITPKILSSGQVFLPVLISYGKNEGASTEIIMRQEITLDLNEPMIIMASHNGEAYYALVYAKSSYIARSEPEQKKVSEPEFYHAPKILQMVPPSYPEELRRRLIGGIVRLIVKINEKGNVLSVGIEEPVNAYLNYSVVQALRQCIFEPVYNSKNKPIPAKFKLSYNFYPSTYNPVISSRSPCNETTAFSTEVLTKTLDKCGEYCQKLAIAALDFVCEETISETHFTLSKSVRWITPVIMTSGGDDPYHNRTIIPYPKVQIMDPSQTKRNKYLCDYQIIRKNEVLQERRIILKENGRAYGDGTKLMNEGRVIGLSPLFASLKILLPAQQSKYFFRIASEEKIQGKKSYIVEASPKSGDENGIWSARIWVDQEKYSILKCEIEGIPIDGYEDVLNDCTALNIKPEFVTTHEYRTEKDGIFLPWRSKVRIAYPGYSPLVSIPKTDMILNYDKFRFFTVESEHHIIR